MSHYRTLSVFLQVLNVQGVKKAQMPDYYVEKFVKMAVEQTITDFFALFRTIAAPVRIPLNHLGAVLEKLETSSQMRLDRSRDRAKVYKEFRRLIKQLELSDNSDESFCFYYLTSISLLPDSPEKEDLIFGITSHLRCDRENAIEKIADAMRQRTLPHPKRRQRTLPHPKRRIRRSHRRLL